MNSSPYFRLFLTANDPAIIAVASLRSRLGVGIRKEDIYLLLRGSAQLDKIIYCFDLIVF